MSFNRTLTFPRQAAAWYAAADLLRDRSWHSLADLGAHVAAGSDLQAASARGILNDAAEAGLLERRMVRRQRQFRVTARGLDQRPELRVR